MKKEEVYGHIDHTLLKAFSTTEQIEAIAEEALKYGTASICIPASFVNYIEADLRKDEELDAEFKALEGYDD